MDYVHGGDIYTHSGMIDFSVNINPLGPSKAVVAAAEESIAQIAQYPDSRVRKLTAVLAAALMIPEEFIIFGNGAADILFSLVLAEKPRKALLLAPTFAEYEQALGTVGCEVSYYIREAKHEFDLGVAYLEALTADLDMIFLCSPDNPTGRTINREFLCEILEICERKNIRMVLDECFYEFLEEPENATMQAYIAQSRNLFILRAFTKMHGMPGLRLGYGICSDRQLLKRIQKVRQPWSVSVVAQAAGCAAVCETDWVKKARTFVSSERRWMEQRFEEIGVEYLSSEVNYILLKSPYDLSELLRAEGILIRDCSNYRGLSKGYYRVSVRKRTDNEKLIEKVARIYYENRENGE